MTMICSCIVKFRKQIICRSLLCNVFVKTTWCFVGGLYKEITNKREDYVRAGAYAKIREGGPDFFDVIEISKSDQFFERVSVTVCPSFPIFFFFLACAGPAPSQKFHVIRLRFVIFFTRENMDDIWSP